jgi:cysteine-rich repeat protein
LLGKATVLFGLLLALIGAGCKSADPSLLERQNDSTDSTDSTSGNLDGGAGGAGDDDDGKGGQSGTGDSGTAPGNGAGGAGGDGAGSDGSNGGSGSGGDGGGDGGDAPVSCSAGECFWSTDVSDTCRSAGIPTPDLRPAEAPDQENASIDDLYFGWSRLWIGQSRPDGTEDVDAWQSFGFDLDGVCTNSASCPDEEDGQMSCAPAVSQIPFDGELCRDNTFARQQPIVAAVPELGEVFGLSEDAFNCSLWQGAYNQITRLSGYNGRQNDGTVRLDFYTSPGLETLPAWSCPYEGYRDDYPLWRPSSPWYVDGDELDGEIDTPGALPPSTRFVDDAFVRDGYLVAFLPADFDIRFAGDRAAFPGWNMQLQGAVLTGKLVRAQDGTWRIEDGLVGGRIRKADLLQAFHRIGVCPDNAFAAFYTAIEQYIDENADLLASGESDPEMPCDAHSMGVAFEARPVTPGGTYAINAAVDCCEPDNFDAPSCTVGCGDGRVAGNELCDTGIASGEEGACPTSCDTEDPCVVGTLEGSECLARCTEREITQPIGGDGCCPDGATANNDSDCPSVCGNEMIEPGESCDPPGSCPTEQSCTPSGTCLQAELTGDPDTCTAVCSMSDIQQCVSDDGCCPDGCDYDSDLDCPEPVLCGNGDVDPGETCDPPGDCPTACDDGNACTRDVLSGSAAECTAKCRFPDIDQPADGDGCCPPGANANTDDDCDPICGNGILEGGETCDDDNTDPLDGCGPTCQVETTRDQCEVLVAEGDDSSACRECTCSSCAEETVACLNSGDPVDDMDCQAVIACGEANGCSGQDCYCGDQDLFWCLILGGNGPCKSEIQAAGDSTDLLTLLDRQQDTSYPLGRANAVGACTNASCSTECGF